ncbi:hypothetical protein EJ05DRAFT_495343 [Pseudovirgaria hyperparasitica]|uniref:Uncharacterized protein n=1 Tax=Pseudovirgaria hyperparasitica TaxID=470096 RepID=A0A6A6WI34_9PEZI|nr:uncharacterized protein EJ05DRAFT_495343 [Pseudovirgaria hyperparasitica]KAF2762462.1 hypothetical protein EJ05DRAFT_495343 [Pseudovirgaria hyperparasitica]
MSQYPSRPDTDQDRFYQPTFKVTMSSRLPPPPCPIARAYTTCPPRGALQFAKPAHNNSPVCKEYRYEDREMVFSDESSSSRQNVDSSTERKQRERDRSTSVLSPYRTPSDQANKQRTSPGHNTEAGIPLNDHDHRRNPVPRHSALNDPCTAQAQRYKASIEHERPDEITTATVTGGPRDTDFHHTGGILGQHDTERKRPSSSKATVSIRSAQPPGTLHRTRGTPVPGVIVSDLEVPHDIPVISREGKHIMRYVMSMEEEMRLAFEDVAMHLTPDGGDEVYWSALVEKGAEIVSTAVQTYLGLLDTCKLQNLPDGRVDYGNRSRNEGSVPKPYLDSSGATRRDEKIDHQAVLTPNMPLKKAMKSPVRIEALSKARLETEPPEKMRASTQSSTMHHQNAVNDKEAKEKFLKYGKELQHNSPYSELMLSRWAPKHIPVPESQQKLHPQHSRNAPVTATRYRKLELRKQRATNATLAPHDKIHSHNYLKGKDEEIKAALHHRNKLIDHARIRAYHSRVLRDKVPENASRMKIYSLTHLKKTYQEGVVKSMEAIDRAITGGASTNQICGLVKNRDQATALLDFAKDLLAKEQAVLAGYTAVKGASDGRVENEASYDNERSGASSSLTEHSDRCEQQNDGESDEKGDEDSDENSDGDSETEGPEGNDEDSEDDSEDNKNANIEANNAKVHHALENTTKLFAEPNATTSPTMKQHTARNTAPPYQTSKTSIHQNQILKAPTISPGQYLLPSARATSLHASATSGPVSKSEQAYKSNSNFDQGCKSVNATCSVAPCDPSRSKRAIPKSRLVTRDVPVPASASGAALPEFRFPALEKGVNTSPSLSAEANGSATGGIVDGTDVLYEHRNFGVIGSGVVSIDDAWLDSDVSENNEWEIIDGSE